MKNPVSNSRITAPLSANLELGVTIMKESHLDGSIVTFPDVLKKVCAVHSPINS